jgi:hypothetical protein
MGKEIVAVLSAGSTAHETTSNQAKVSDFETFCQIS